MQVKARHLFGNRVDIGCQMVSKARKGTQEAAKLHEVVLCNDMYGRWHELYALRR